MPEMTYATPLAWYPDHDTDNCWHDPRCQQVFDFTGTWERLDALVEALENGTPKPAYCQEDPTVFAVVVDPHECERLHRVLAVSRIVCIECSYCGAPQAPGPALCRECAYSEAMEIWECERNCSYPERTCSRCD